MLEDILKGLLKDVIIKNVLARLVTMLPFLGWPIIGPIVAHFVSKFALIFFDEMSLVVAFKVIDGQIGKEKDEYSAATEQLKSVISVAETPAEEIERAKERVRHALNGLVKFQRAAT